ncbi:hypothetical protein F6476_19400 [Pseudomonas umsongensis]|nr:hypothetical protein [Pseudomonas umsongensis]QFG31194.1 hypothetical protein F6476_19400 [Pseudomonas umsongensis]
MFCGGKFLRSLTRSLGGQVGFGGGGDGMNDGSRGSEQVKANCGRIRASWALVRTSVWCRIT